MRLLPITAKLNPFAGAQNWAYLLQIAALTRLCTGMARVITNRPSANHDPSLSLNDKRQSCSERFFVEIIGTIGTIFSLHLGQDLTSKLLQPGLQKKMHQLIQQIDEQSKLPKTHVVQSKQALAQVYGSSSKTLISRYLYGGKTVDNKPTTISLARLKTTLNNDKLFEQLRKSTPLDNFATALRRRSAFSVLGGVAASALFGGFITQWLNDRLFAPTVRKTLDKRSPNAQSTDVFAPSNDSQTQFSGPSMMAPIATVAKQLPSKPMSTPHPAIMPLTQIMSYPTIGGM